jgi:hypothetical protein
VPKRVFKAILDETPPRKAIGFIMYQEDSTADLYPKRVVSVDEIEKIIGFDLFADDPGANELESAKDLAAWHGSLECVATPSGRKRSTKPRPQH